MTEETPPAVKRGVEMMSWPTKDIPTPAMLYAAYLCNSYGMCGEVLLTAWIVYAQIVEGLSCGDALYSVTEAVRAEWDQIQQDFIRIDLPDGRIQVVKKNA
jgi:hypothetical protein